MAAPVQTSVGTSAVAVSASAVPRNFTVIKALSTNTGRVFIGVSNGVLTTTGFELSAGESIAVPVAEAANASGIWAIGSAASQTICVWVI